MQKETIKIVFRRILKDIKVLLGDEFDRNFQRQGFFSEGWQRKRSPVNKGKPILINTGNLRSSLRSETSDTSIRFFTDLPYAAIHNEGGEIKVTRRMQRYFWARMYEAQGAFGRRKNGTLRQTKKNARLTEEAEFWRAMALKPVGSKIVIPKRQFLGTNEEVEQWVEEIIEDNVGSLEGLFGS